MVCGAWANGSDEGSPLRVAASAAGAATVATPAANSPLSAERRDRRASIRSASGVALVIFSDVSLMVLLLAAIAIS